MKNLYLMVMILAALSSQDAIKASMIYGQRDLEQQANHPYYLEDERKCPWWNPFCEDKYSELIIND